MKTTTTRLVKLSVLAGALLCATQVFGYNANNWQPVDGDWNGKYSDVRHWSRGHLPDVKEGIGEDAVFKNTSGHEIVIELDVRVGEGGVPIPAFFKLGTSNDPVAGGLSPVRFVGNGYMTQSANSSMYCYANTHLILDDHVTFEWAKGMSGATNRTMEVCGNAVFNMGSTTLGWRIYRQTGGNATFNPSYDASAPEACEFSVTGGTLTIPSLNFQPVEGVKYDLSGTGRIVHQSTEMHVTGLLPKDEAVLVCDRPYQDSAIFETGTNELSGTLYVTNNSVAYVKFNGERICLYGGGMVCCGSFYIDKPGAVIDLGRVNVGNQVNPTGGAYEFMRPFAWGVYGKDWNGSNNSYVTYLNGLTADTRDCFDPDVARSITVGSIEITPGTSLAATGGGTASFAIRRPHANGLYARALDVADNTTMEISDGSAAISENRGRIRFGEINLGAGSTLRCRASGNNFEAATITAADDAKVTVSVADLTASEGQGTGGDLMVYSVVSAPLGTGVKLANVEVTDNAGTWKAKQVGPVIYLRDETLVTVVDDAYRWTGTAMDGDWSNPENWANGTATPPSNGTVYFTICDTTNIVTIPSGGITLASFKGGGNCKAGGKGFWARSSEPYIIRGGKLTLTSASTGSYSATFYDAGRLPKIFECDVEGTGATMGVLPYAYVMFKGAFTAKKLCFAGALYFAGTANVTELAPHKTYAGSADASIVVAPGGNLTVSAQANMIVPPIFDFAVLGGGSATINGTSYACSNAVPHVVDGTLAVNAPLTLDFDGVEVFAGTGRVDIASFAPAADRNARIELRNAIRVNFGSCNTVSAANPSGVMAIDIKHFQHPMIGAKGDWTYGPAAGVVPTTAAADRALRLGFRAELTLDTEDPDTGAAHAVTFADPIVGQGTLIKKGKGALVLGTDACAIDELRLEGGTVDVAENLRSSKWADVMSVNKVTGDLVAADGVKLRFIEETSTLQAKIATGLLLMVR